MSSSTSKLFNKVDSSDYITAKRRMTIAKENLNISIPNVKNNNYTFIPTTAAAIDASHCLIQAKSFDLLQDYIVGTDYVQQQCI